MAGAVEPIVTFFKAVKENDLALVDEFLNTKRISIDVRNAEERNATALHLAAYYGYEKLAQLLVDKYCADVNAVDDGGEIPLQTAADNYHANICKFFIANNSDNADYASVILNSKEVDALFEAAEANDIGKVSAIIKSETANVDSVDKGGYNATILHVAARKGYDELARVLVDQFKANINHMDDIGDRPIHVAAQNDNLKIVYFLIERNSKDIDDVKDFLQ